MTDLPPPPSNGDRRRPGPPPLDRPSHPRLPAALLMLGVVAFLVLVSLLSR